MISIAFRTPIDTILRLLEARATGKLAMAVACYEPHATVVAQPGQSGSGEDAIKSFTEATSALPITFSERTIIEAGDIALHVSGWTIRSTGSLPISGRTADVLRRQEDGRWLIAIDNPWGTTLPDSGLPP